MNQRAIAGELNWEMGLQKICLIRDFPVLGSFRFSGFVSHIYTEIFDAKERYEFPLLI